MSQPTPHSAAHSPEWDDRLQDWLDGELDAAASAAFQAHLHGCADCQQAVEALERLDTALVQASPPLALNSAFDDRLFAQIDAIDDSKRVEARRRLELELQQQLQALSRNWRRTLAFVIPGVVAGIALAFTLTGWFDSSGMTNTLVAEGAAELGGGSADFLRIGLTAMIGATLGALVAPWLARLAE
jgi:anti-sigma factor RsiW